MPTSLARQNLRTTQLALYSFAVAVSLSALWYWWRRGGTAANSGSARVTSEKGRPGASAAPERQSEEQRTPGPDVTAAKTRKDDEKALHAEIEELDRKGKAYFKAKQYLDAAQTFTEALDLISRSSTANSAALQKQAITLLNNRSAMYEKAELPELALEDCSTILETDPMHVKARARKLRLLETSLQRPMDALVEVCATQLLHMQAHRANLRMGLPIPPPPVSESKLHELLANILPEAMEPYIKDLEDRTAAGGTTALPSPYTIVQLLKSYTNYNSWMAKAARSGTASSMVIPEADDTESTANRVVALLKRGQRYVYDGRYDLASADFEEGFKLVTNIGNTAEKESVLAAMPGDSYPRLLDWTGMTRHWRYKLDESLKAYRMCADIEPMNALVLVKQAGVQMDKAELDEALKLFDMALGLDPTCVDALLHRSNLRMLQAKSDDAKTDLLKCLELKPNHVMARLRLASIYASVNDVENAERQLDLAEKEDPTSSDVHSHRGELFFTQNKMEEAREKFEKAIELEPSNPTPYVNNAMAILNTPVAGGQLPDTAAVMDFLERAIEVDPSFVAAYMQLGQLALGTATDLNAAKEVVKLYDNGLANCRTKEEIKELVSMRLLAVAQVDAASMLGMEKFNMQ